MRHDLKVENSDNSESEEIVQDLLQEDEFAEELATADEANPFGMEGEDEAERLRRERQEKLQRMTNELLEQGNSYILVNPSEQSQLKTTKL